jgi:signal transduction histidine kinase
MRITTKFIGSSTLLIALSASLFGSSYAINQRARKSLGDIYTQAEVAVATVAQLDVALEAQVSALSRLAILENDAAEVQLYRQSRQAFFQALDTLEANTPEDDQLFELQLEGIRRQHKYLDDMAAHLISPSLPSRDAVANGHAVAKTVERTKRTDQTGDQAQQIIRSLKLFEQTIRGPIQSVQARAKEQTATYQLRQEAFHDQLVWLEMLNFGLVILLLLAQFYGLLRPVTKALQRLQSGTERLGLENAESAQAKIRLTTGDELQALAEAFNRMSDRLRSSYQNLELRVAHRTASLHKANQALLMEVSDRLEAEASLRQALTKLKQTQLQLLQTEKMSSLGQLVAGVAHEINNPVSFIQGNLEPAQDYMNSLLRVIRTYQAECPVASEKLRTTLEQADLTFIEADFPQLLGSMQTGAERISQIVRSLQTFSHLDESETKPVDIHKGIESAIFLVTAQLGATQHRPAIQIIRHYADLPQVYSYPSQLNQVFMGLLTNGIDALSPQARSPEGNTASQGTIAEPTITITTERGARGSTDFVRIRFTDNGVGISEDARSRIFDPFFTTKPVGSGMGLGLSMSYQIMVVNHKGKLTCESELGVGSTFTLEIPLNLQCQLKPIEPLVGVAAMPGLLTP